MRSSYPETLLQCATRETGWITCPVPRPLARLRLFCFPFAGGSALTYRDWAQDLPASIEVCPIQLPGRGNRSLETPCTRLAPLVRDLTSALCSYLDRPFTFFGHSLGALISFEVALRLRAQVELSPVHLFVSGCRAPHLPSSSRPIHALPDAEFVEEIRRLGGTPNEVLQNADIMQLLLPMLRADFAAYETYTYEAAQPLDCPISALGGWHDRETTQDELAAWQDHTGAQFQLHMFPGDHFFLRHARVPILQLLSRHLVSPHEPVPPLQSSVTQKAPSVQSPR